MAPAVCGQIEFQTIETIYILSGISYEGYEVQTRITEWVEDSALGREKNPYVY